MNIFKKQINREEGEENDLWLFDLGKQTEEIKPKKELLSKILDNVETENVTNIESIRNSITEEGRVLRVNYFANFINNMNKAIKIISGTAVVAALIVVVIFTNKSEKKVEPVLNNRGIVSEESVQVMVGDTIVDTDSLVADLSAIDSTVEESIVDDSDLLLELTNSNDYEIQ